MKCKYCNSINIELRLSGPVVYFYDLDKETKLFKNHAREILDDDYINEGRIVCLDCGKQESIDINNLKDIREQ